MNLRTIFEYMTKKQASDLHLKVGSNPAMRVDGEIMYFSKEKLLPPHMEAVAKSLLNEEQYQKLQQDRELDFAFGVPGIGRFRANCYYQRSSISIVLRRIPFEVPNLESLGLPPVVRDLAEKRRGLVLCTGITGSGKSSTLAAMLNHLNENSHANIITIEDPIEFLFSDRNCLINQREIGTDTKDFASALRNALRQDPDVIMVGEIRDAETASIALKAANTGHLVLSTLHTIDATQTIARILGFFPPHQHEETRLLLASTLQGILAQRLLRRKDGEGRILALEILTSTETIRTFIRDSSKTDLIREAIREGSQEYGMQTFDQHLAQLYGADLIDYQTALENSSSPEEFELFHQGYASGTIAEV